MSLANKPVHVLIAVPSFRGTVMVHTTQSLMQTVMLFGELGIRSHFINIDSAEIVSARNTMASMAWRTPEATHLLFVDDDMSFEPDAVVDLLRANKPVIGAICPKRSIDLKRVYEAGLAGRSFTDALSSGLTFVTQHLKQDSLKVDGGLIQVGGIGMGVTLIRKDALTTMVERKVVTTYLANHGEKPDDFGNTEIHGFFDQIYDEEQKSMLSEDLSFCHRWTKQCGGEVWATVDRKIGHIGMHIYAGAYIDKLKAGES
jgi:hypothetical protein